MSRSILSTTRSFRPTAALVVACLALLVAMGGTGYASGLITGKQVKNSSLTGKDVKDAALTGADVADGGITGADVTDAGITSADVANDSLTGVDVAAESLTAADVAPDSLGGKVIDEKNLSSVPTADYAKNADNLDGHSAGYFEPLHGCYQGKVLGFAHVRGNDGTMPATYTASATFVHAPFNCAEDAEVQVRRIAVGQYRVRFLQNPAYIAMAQVRTDTDSTDADLCIGIAKELTPGVDLNAFEVTVTTCDGTSTPRDANFTLLLP